MNTATATSHNIDPRLTRLSHSGRTTLHRCPRKYQLQKIARMPFEVEENVTFAYGHAVGLGIQCLLEGKSWNQTVLEMFAGWEIADLYAEEAKTSKSFFYAVFAVQAFIPLRTTAFKDYELAYFNEKPAVELSFRISLLHDFTYRGFVDVVLKHKVTGKLLVLEVKTTGAKYVTEATFKNSGQALGYSLVLDAIAPGESEYEVWYLVYMSGMQRYEILPFRKHYSDRAFWIQELMMDVDRILYYEEHENYPSYGESCYDFSRVCEFYSNCTMSTRMLKVAYNPVDDMDRMDKPGAVGYNFELNLIDLINAQLDRQEI